MIRIEDNTKCLFYQKNEANIKVAQYLIALSDKQWFIDKLNKSIAIARQSVATREDEHTIADKALDIAKQNINTNSL
jgi:Uri superfamily endonuclease